MFGMKPRENVFFDLFSKSAQNAHTAANLLNQLLTDFQDVPNRVRQIHNVEHQGDEFTHQILEYLAKTFITPLDREDIHTTATRLDDVVDQMNTAANRLELFKVRVIPDDAKALGQVLVKSTRLLIDAFEHLSNLKKPQVILNICIEIHTQENEGDRLMQHGLGCLFDGGHVDAIEVIKWKDIYQILEKATDRCEDVADVLQTIVVKHG